jgi:hypothetical protein
VIKSYALRYGWEPTKLTAVLFQFGPLQEAQQEQLIRCLVLAFGRYQMRVKTVQRIAPSEQRKQLQIIANTARKLLLQLGINPEAAILSNISWPRDLLRSLVRSLSNQSQQRSSVTMWLASVGIVTAGREEAAINAELSKATDCVNDAVLALLDLYERAQKAALTATTRITAGRGGSRHRPNAKGQLIRDALEIYAHTRRQYPESGKKPGIGGPMLRFIHAIADLFGARVRDSDVSDVWRVWKSKHR